MRGEAVGKRFDLHVTADGLLLLDTRKRGKEPPDLLVLYDVRGEKDVFKVNVRKKGGGKSHTVKLAAVGRVQLARIDDHKIPFSDPIGRVPAKNALTIRKEVKKLQMLMPMQITASRMKGKLYRKIFFEGRDTLIKRKILQDSSSKLKLCGYKSKSS